MWMRVAASEGMATMLTVTWLEFEELMTLF